MTNDEAINMLYGIQADNLNLNDAYTKDKYDALDMAIKALSGSEKPNKCDDAISRQAILDATVNKNSIWNSITNSKGENLEEIISQLPSVNQQEPCSNCCNGNQIEKAKLCQKSYLAGIEHNLQQEPKTGWIPVSERLPEIHQDVLLSLRSLDVEVGFRGSTEPYYYCHGGYIDPQNVLAWQPLPEPYTAEGGEAE